MSSKLLTNLRSFAETTSVRGIPRVMKAKTRVTFVVWLVAVLTCAALLVWQLSVVLTRYFQYPVTTLTVQAPAWQNPTFPDITICKPRSTHLPRHEQEFVKFGCKCSHRIHKSEFLLHNERIADNKLYLFHVVRSQLVPTPDLGCLEPLVVQMFHVKPIK